MSGILYHLCPRSHWAAAIEAGKYFPSTYQQDGFTHLTEDPRLLIPVANTFYTQDPGDWIVLCLDASKLSGEVKFEPAAPVGTRSAASLKESMDEEAPLFPHLYGPIDVEAVTETLAVTRDSDGTFLAIAGLDSTTGRRTG